MNTGLKETRIRHFVLFLLISLFLIVAFFFEGRINEQNTTALALSYEFGLIPRGFIGTVLQIIKSIFGVNLFTYHRVFLFSILVTIIYYVVLFVFYYICLKKTSEIELKNVELLIIFLSIFMFTEFLSWNNFGRLDEYLMIITIVSLILLITEKCEYLLIPLSIIACLIHVGFVFTNINVILVVLIWKIFEKSGKERNKYFVIFSTCFICVSVLFVYFELLQPPLSRDSYDAMASLAESISEDGESISDSLLDSEILKKNVFFDEWVWHTKNYVEFPIFIMLFSPYIYIWIHFIKGLIKKTKNIIDKLKYIIVLAGAGTILPSLILKVDYGRWMFCIFSYYCLIILVLMILGDALIQEQFNETKIWIKNKLLCNWVLLIYPLMFMPFRDVYISDVTTKIMDFVAPILGFW